MQIKSVTHFATCRSMKDGERCKFFKGMPPLKPGFNDVDDMSGLGVPDEIEIPDGLKGDKHEGAHFVYLVGGDFLPDNEAAVFVMVHGEPVCWLVQCGEVFQGQQAIKRAFGDLVDVEGMNDPHGAVEAVFEACDRLSRAFGIDYVVGIRPGGTDMLFQSNNSDMIDIHREAQEQWEQN